MEASKAFGQILRLARKEAGFTQEQLAHEAGLQRNYVSLLERGVHEPTLTTMLKLSAALKCSAGSMVCQVEDYLS